MVQRLRLQAPNVGGPGSVPGQGTRYRKPPTKSPHAATKKIPHVATKIPRATTKTKHSQINK